MPLRQRNCYYKVARTASQPAVRTTPCFYTAEALLFEKGLEFRKHGGVRAAFGKHFAKTREVDSRYHRYLIEAFESRLEADYGVDIVLSTSAVNDIIQRAHEFLAVARSHLESGKAS